MGPGCVLFIQSEDFTGGEWAIWSDNIAMARWFQTTQLTASTPDDTDIPVVLASFESSGDPNYFWTETCTSSTGNILEMTFTDIGGEWAPCLFAARVFRCTSCIVQPAASFALCHSSS